MNSRTADRSRSSVVALRERGVVLCRGLHDGLERFELLSRSLDGVVSLGQVVEVGDDVAHALGRVARFEHVVAHEVVEVADRLHRDGLVEQLECLLRSDSEQATQRGCVLGEFVEDLRPGSAQPLAEITQIRAEVGEVRRDRECFGCGDEEAVGLSGALALLEDLGQGDRLVVAVVGEDPEDRRSSVRLFSRSPLARDRPVASFRSDL